MDDLADLLAQITLLARQVGALLKRVQVEEGRLSIEYEGARIALLKGGMIQITFWSTRENKFVVLNGDQLLDAVLKR